MLFEAGEISTMPAIKLLSGENVRQGFIEKADFDKLLTPRASEINLAVARPFPSHLKVPSLSGTQYRIRHVGHSCTNLPSVFYWF